jgi:hypothetical protein
VKTSLRSTIYRIYPIYLTRIVATMDCHHRISSDLAKAAVSTLETTKTIERVRVCAYRTGRSKSTA